MKLKKRMKIPLLISTLLLLLSASLASAIPVLQISNITGGFEVHATIKNTRSTPSYDIN